MKALKKASAQGNEIAGMTLDAGAYDIVVNGDHLLAWGVEPSEIQDAALRNLSAWSATATWTD